MAISWAAVQGSIQGGVRAHDGRGYCLPCCSCIQSLGGPTRARAKGARRDPALGVVGAGCSIDGTPSAQSSMLPPLLLLAAAARAGAWPRLTDPTRRLRG